MTRQCLIITGGDRIDKDRLLSFVDEDTYIICADKGGETALKYNLKPDVLLGDMDSIDSEMIKEIDSPVMEYPEDKDYTDTELAVSYAIENGFEEIILANATGDRIDHVFGTFMLLYKYKRYKIKIVGNNYEAFIIYGDYKVFNMKGKTLSIIPVARELTGVFLEGFKYPLNDRKVDLGDSLCISNIITDDEAYIRLKKGTAIVIITDLEEKIWKRQI